MIKVTRLNGKDFYINAIYIETVEAFPDTTIILTNGKRYVVQQSETEIVNLTTSFFRQINLLSHKQKEGDKNEK